LRLGESFASLRDRLLNRITKRTRVRRNKSLTRELKLVTQEINYSKISEYQKV